MNLAKISTKVSFWPQEEDQLNYIVNRLLLREAGKEVQKRGTYDVAELRRRYLVR